MSAVIIEDADPPAFGGDVDTLCAGIVGQHVGRFPNLLAVDHTPVGQVDSDHRGVGFAADEHHLIGVIESLTVWVVAVRCGNACCHSETHRINHGEIVTSLHGDDHLIPRLVVYDVSHLTAQGHRGADCAGVRVDHRFGARRLVGRPNRVPDRVVGQPVGIGVGRCAEYDCPGIFVDGDQLVAAGCGGVNPVFV